MHSVYILELKFPLLPKSDWAMSDTILVSVTGARFSIAQIIVSWCQPDPLY